MKKSIITTGLIASSMLNINAATSKTLNSNATEAYKWRAETENNVFTGTCLSINEVNKEIEVLTNNDRVLRKNITPVSLKDKVFIWSVVTNNGQANGVTESLEEAKKTLKMFGDKEIIESKIMESYNTSK